MTSIQSNFQGFYPPKLHLPRPSYGENKLSPRLTVPSLKQYRCLPIQALEEWEKLIESEAKLLTDFKLRANNGGISHLVDKKSETELRLELENLLKRKNETLNYLLQVNKAPQDCGTLREHAFSIPPLTNAPTFSPHLIQPVSPRENAYSSYNNSPLSSPMSSPRTFDESGNSTPCSSPFSSPRSLSSTPSPSPFSSPRSLSTTPSASPFNSPRSLSSSSTTTLSPRESHLISGESLLLLVQQPEYISSNTIIDPAYVLEVNRRLLNCNGEYQITACLKTYPEGTSVNPDYLQGVKSIPLHGSQNVAVFGQLAIVPPSNLMETYVFQFYLEHRLSGFFSAVSYIESAPFRLYTRGYPVTPNIYRKRPPVDDSLRSRPSMNKRLKQHRSSDLQYVDITSLLDLPQKEAAAKLNISESMLCKRFKECTKRKWPYRYLRKIDKTIQSLKAQKESGTITPDDALKLEKFISEREACLRPIKIRISGNDRAKFLKEFSASARDDDEITDEVVHTLLSIHDKP
eukprot:TRINITY_DN1922_c0_g2_i1.p1 TRINITY_DN1922_c0_g2~~TRINITY_DN1922_c0_g2_i1.p1  ORF type:complete len:517 (-),score=66.52 TRINITY_DN1922_c0_g2_i1:103-1653(-)